MNACRLGRVTRGCRAAVLPMLLLATGAVSIAGPEPSGTAPFPLPVRSKYVGTNLGGLAYYESNFPFSDLVRTGGGWTASDNTPFAATNADGTPAALKPGQTATTSIAWPGSRYPAGRYTVLWDGMGTIGFPRSRVRIVERGPHRIVLEPAGQDDGLFVGIDATNPADPVRNVRFLLPGTESTYARQPFNPTWLQRLAPFSLIRFMDWGATNGSPVVEWADRVQPTEARVTGGRGVPIEVMVDLANTLRVDPWFCVPHQASDDYVRRFAELLHARLDPALKPHIEYSNEVWNAGFEQSKWASRQADLQKLPRPMGLPALFYAKRAVQVFRIVRSVYGPRDAPRVVRVLAGQAAWSQFLESALATIDPANDVDAIAIAPYFVAGDAADPAHIEATLRGGVDAVVDQMLRDVRGPVKARMTAAAALAAKYRLPLLGYEGGPSDSAGAFPPGRQEAVLALLKAAHSSPRMEQVYAEYLAEWQAAGGSTLVQYFDVGRWTQWGLWGALEATFQDPATAPKYRGLMTFIAAHPAPAGR